MKSLDKPENTLSEIFADCIVNISSTSKKQSFELILDDLLLMAEDYDQKGNAEKLHEITTHNSVGAVSKDDLRWLYTNKLSKLKEVARSHYDKIRGSAPLDICPFCSQRRVSTVDHVLPKGSYSGYSITPYNLVPACKDCNTDKNEHVPNSAGEVHLHPYYDCTDDGRWLFCEVLNTNPITFDFRTERNSDWSAELNDRIETHFNLFGLRTLYNTHAAATLPGLSYLKDINLIEGQENLRIFLERAALRKFEKKKNSWDTVMHKTLAESDWFCREGVLRLY